MKDKVVQTAFRLPASLIQKIDHRAAEMARDTGMRVTRTDVVRMLLWDALKKRKK